MTKVVNADWLPGSEKQPHKHTVMPRRSRPWGIIAGFLLGMTWLEAVSASCFLPKALSFLSSPAASPAAVFLQETGSSQACQCLGPGSAALCLMTPTALHWQLKNEHALLAMLYFNSLINSWDPCSVTFMAHLSSSVPELTFPHFLNLTPRPCTDGQLKRCNLAVSHISSTFFTMVIVEICFD